MPGRCSGTGGTFTSYFVLQCLCNEAVSCHHSCTCKSGYIFWLHPIMKLYLQGRDSFQGPSVSPPHNIGPSIALEALVMTPLELLDHFLQTLLFKQLADYTKRFWVPAACLNPCDLLPPAPSRAPLKLDSCFELKNLRISSRLRSIRHWMLLLDTPHWQQGALLICAKDVQEMHSTHLMDGAPSRMVWPSKEDGPAV